jgi:hypothetical protein
MPKVKGEPVPLRDGSVVESIWCDHVKKLIAFTPSLSPTIEERWK